MLRDATKRVGNLEWRSGFDGIASAGQLAAGLSDRAEVGAASLKDALIEHANTVTALNRPGFNGGRFDRKGHLFRASPIEVLERVARPCHADGYRCP